MTCRRVGTLSMITSAPSGHKTCNLTGPFKEPRPKCATGCTMIQHNYVNIHQRPKLQKIDSSLGFRVQCQMENLLLRRSFYSKESFNEMTQKYQKEHQVIEIKNLPPCSTSSRCLCHGSQNTTEPSTHQY